MKYWLSLIVSSLIFMNINTVYAEDFSNNIEQHAKAEITDINTQVVINKDNIADLQKYAISLQDEIDNNKNQIDLINQIIFFYSDKNITNIFEAVQNSKIETTPVIQFADTECGYPIYNGAQRKLDKLIRKNAVLVNNLKSTQKQIAEIQALTITLKK